MIQQFEKKHYPRDILVNLPSGQAEIYYDNGQIEDVNRIADAITAGGYPAKVTEVLSADQIRKERNLATVRSLNYIASVVRRTDSF